MINRIDKLTETFMSTMNDLLLQDTTFIYSMDLEAIHYLYFDEANRLLSFCAVIPLDESTIECVGFTHPRHRNQGYFKSLLDEISLEWEDRDIIFSLSTPSDDTAKTLDALCVEHIGTDYLMEYKFHDAINLSATLPSNLNLVSKQEDDAIISWTLQLNSTEIGLCEISLLSERKCCLHHVGILETYRSRGYGTYLLQLLLHALEEIGIRNIVLHVEESNTSAVSLYKKTGFLITETLSSYLY